MSEISKLEIVGVLYKVFEAQPVTASMTKREFVVETQEQYPQLIKFELVNDKCGLIDQYKTGDLIKVSFNIRGREWKKDANTTVYFTNLAAWRLEHAGAGHTGSGTGNAQHSAPVQPPVVESKPVPPVNSPDDDLPF